MTVDVIGTLPERRHDLRLRWYKKNGPQLVNLASRVLSFQDIPNVGCGHLILDKTMLVYEYRCDLTHNYRHYGKRRRR